MHFANTDGPGPNPMMPPLIVQKKNSFRVVIEIRREDGCLSAQRLEVGST